MKKFVGPPIAQGLYEPSQEHDACGVGFVVDMKGRKSRKIVENALTILQNLLHRGRVDVKRTPVTAWGSLYRYLTNFTNAYAMI